MTQLTVRMRALMLGALCALLPIFNAHAAATITTTTTLSSSANTVAVGTPVTLTATVVAASGTGPTGTVTFKKGTTTLGTGTLSGTGLTRTATFSTTFTTVASNSLTAVYAGDASSKTSTSAAKTVSSTKASSTSTVSSSLNPSISGNSVTFTATVVGYNPTGTVTFKDGATTLGSGTLSGTGNTRTATYIKANLTIASHSITAVYAGNTLNNTSTSSALNQVVNAPAAASTTTVASNLNPSTSGTSVTFTASVTGSAPSGVVTFKDGATTLGTGTLSGTGNTRTATYATTALSVASHSITALYAGDSANLTSTSAALSQVVNQVAVASTTSLSATPGSATAGSSVSLTATVSGNNPTGSVTFTDGSAVLGTANLTAGVATLATNALTTGGHNISAQYTGDAGNQPSSSNSVLVNITAVGLGAMTWQYGYDAMGRPTTVVDPNNLATYTYYDALGRPIQTQQPANTGSTIPTVISLDYNLADSLTQVTDPRNLATTYSPNGLGNVTQQSSPDTGLTGYTYDAAGRLLSQTDARGKLTSMGYDTAGRLKTITYPTGVPTTLEYDGGTTPYPGATGELTKISDESGSTSYSFDSAGRLTSKTSLINGKTFTVGYGWGDSGSAIDKLTSITYPSGTRINYSYDAQGYRTAISVSPVNPNGVGTGAAQNLLSAIGYNADNSVTGWTWANGIGRTIGYGTYGQVASYNLGDPTGTGISAGSLRTVVRDGAGRITGYSHSSAGVPNQSFGYDNLNRLVNATLGTTTTQYSYDATGNRTAKTIGSTTYANTVAPTSNRYTQTQDITGTASVQYDAAGHITNDGANTFTYSDRGRIATASNAGGTVNYLYNALELRVAKTGPTALIATGASYYVYDEQGQLLGEYDANQNPLYESIYLGSIPVGVLKQSGTVANSDIATSIYNVYSDHLNTARVITRPSDNAIAWRWDVAEAFGATLPDQNPSGLGSFVFNQRLPGQTFDSETGLFDNWNRTYDPRQGRYRQSDPIGLAGGINTYSYVSGNPLSLIDPRGLDNPRLGPYGPYWNVPSLDIPAMSTWLNDNAYSSSRGQCAKYVRLGLEAAGANTSGHPVAAADYANTVQRNGYVPITAGSYVPREGDITVISRTDQHAYGHIVVYDGRQWISDFKQKNQSPYADKTIPMQVYRHPVNGSDCGCQ